MARQPLGRNGRSRPLTADGSAVTTDACGLGDKPKLHKASVIDPCVRRRGRQHDCRRHRAAV